MMFHLKRGNRKNSMTSSSTTVRSEPPPPPPSHQQMDGRLHSAISKGRPRYICELQGHYTYSDRRKSLQHFVIGPHPASSRSNTPKKPEWVPKESTAGKILTVRRIIERVRAKKKILRTVSAS